MPIHRSPFRHPKGGCGASEGRVRSTSEAAPSQATSAVDRLAPSSGDRSFGPCDLLLGYVSLRSPWERISSFQGSAQPIHEVGVEVPPMLPSAPTSLTR